MRHAYEWMIGENTKFTASNAKLHNVSNTLQTASPWPYIVAK